MLIIETYGDVLPFRCGPAAWEEKFKICGTL